MSCQAKVVCLPIGSDQKDRLNSVLIFHVSRALLRPFPRGDLFDHLAFHGRKAAVTVLRRWLALLPDRKLINIGL